MQEKNRFKLCVHQSKYLSAICHDWIKVSPMCPFFHSLQILQSSLQEATHFLSLRENNFDNFSLGLIPNSVKV